MCRLPDMQACKAAVLFSVLVTCCFAAGVGGTISPTPTSQAPNCICFDLYDPVCSTTNVTFTNVCHLKCAKQHLAYKGVCKCLCPKIYVPVCSTKNKTYNNVCQLACAKERVAYKGVCRPPPCPHIHHPVCGQDNRTYDNECLMSRAGIKKAHDGICHPPCNCHDHDTHPVCDVHTGTSFASACVAQCQGVRHLHNGACPYKPCKFLCVNTYDPVCSTGNQTFNNTCWLRCANAVFAYYGMCRPAPCPNILQPVCGTNGKVFDETLPCCRRDYDNDCLLRRAGAQKAYDGKCRPPCVCPLNLYNPVCDTSTHTSYINSCVAKCQDVKQFIHGACAHRPCNSMCTAIYAPVCSARNHTYSNICQLRCANAVFAYNGTCGTCNCPSEKSPVCWKGKTYDNGCLAICDGARSKDVVYGTCGQNPLLCMCQLPSPPQYVCAPGFMTFASACDARCHGYPGPYQSGNCTY